jgi:hypothetical protein
MYTSVVEGVKWNLVRAYSEGSELDTYIIWMGTEKPPP